MAPEKVLKALEDLQHNTPNTDAEAMRFAISVSELQPDTGGSVLTCVGSSCHNRSAGVGCGTGESAAARRESCAASLWIGWDVLPQHVWWLHKPPMAHYLSADFLVLYAPAAALCCRQAGPGVRYS